MNKIITALLRSHRFPLVTAIVTKPLVLPKHHVPKITRPSISSHYPTKSNSIYERSQKIANENVFLQARVRDLESEIVGQASQLQVNKIYSFIL